MGQWNHMYCRLSKEKSDNNTMKEVEVNVLENGRHCQSLLRELNPEYDVSFVYSLQELISMFDKRLKLCSLEDMIIIFTDQYGIEDAAITVENWEMTGEMIYLATLIKMMKEEDFNYVWTRITYD